MGLGGTQHDVSHFGGALRGEGGDDVIEFSFLGCDTSRTKLCLYLSEPDFWVGRPIRRELEADGGDSACVGIHGHGGCVFRSRRGHQYGCLRDKTDYTHTRLHLYIEHTHATHVLT